MTQQKIVCFGEIMLRLTPMINAERLEQTQYLHMGFAGAESNIATALAVLKNNVEFLTLLPDNPLGNAAINLLRKHGVSTTFIKQEGKRIGTYFIESGTSIRPAQVIYDRENSSLANLQPFSITWKEILAGASHFMLTGITPALSDACAEACLQAVTCARDKGVKICFDLNYRRKLWPKEKARQVLAKFIPYIDVLFCNEGSVADILGIELPEEQATLSFQQYYRLLAEKIALTGEYEQIAMTHREHTSASRNTWSGMLYQKRQLFFSNPYHLSITDRFGTGDAFAAGCIHGLVRGWQPQDIIEFATAASALKHTIPGDLMLFSEAEIRHVMTADGSGRVLR